MPNLDALTRIAQEAENEPTDQAAWDKFCDVALPPLFLALLDVARAAEKYRAIILADPTSLDRPSGGKALDVALAKLKEQA